MFDFNDFVIKLGSFSRFIGHEQLDQNFFIWDLKWDD